MEPLSKSGQRHWRPSPSPCSDFFAMDGFQSILPSCFWEPGSPSGRGITALTRIWVIAFQYAGGSARAGVNQRQLCTVRRVSCRQQQGRQGKQALPHTSAGGFVHHPVPLHSMPIQELHALSRPLLVPAFSPLQAALTISVHQDSEVQREELSWT